MASIVTQNDQNGPKWVQNGPKWVQNGSKTGPKRGQKGVKSGSQNGSPRGRNQKKVEKYFFSGPTMGGYRGAPSKKPGFGKVLPTQTMLSPIFEKKCGFPPPAGPSAGGGTALFSKIRRIQGVDWCNLPKTVFLEGGAYNPL